jgi:hypothetical protein
VKICLSCDGVTDTQAQCCGHCGAWLVPTDTVHYPVRTGEVDAGNPLLGTIVDGKYRLLSVLGRGGLGTVFRAQHIRSLMTVAVKLLHPRFQDRPEYRRSLLPEARRAATVANQHCARLLDVGEAEGGLAYLAMELVDGRTLDVVMRSGPLPPAHAVTILRQVAEALGAIHANGLVHCDLSPRNVMVAAHDGDLHVKVLDFGIARSSSLASGDRSGGALAGFANPAFAAPELLAGGAVEARADLYSLGTLGWFLLSGTMPVDDAEPKRAASAVAAGDLRPWPGTKGVPRRLVRLLLRCLQHPPEARPASAAAVAAELAAIARANRPVLARTAIAAAALAIVAAIATHRGQQPFLRVWPGSALQLVAGERTSAPPVQELTSQRLATFGCHFGGFDPRALRVEIARDGRVLRRTALLPEVDADDGTLLLSTALPSWRELLETLLVLAGEGPVDLTFVVPGALPLGTARVRLDDVPPRAEAALVPAEGGLFAASQLRWRAEDAIGVVAARAVVQFDDGASATFELAGGAGEFALGDALARQLGRTGACGPGRVQVRAQDRAGNVADSAPLPFASADVAAPALLGIAGPGGEPWLPQVGDVLRARVALSAVEADCVLEIARGALPPHRAPLQANGTMQLVELPASLAVDGVATLHARVLDRAGNSRHLDLVLPVRDLSLRPVVTPVDAAARWVGGELVVGEAGAMVGVAFGPAWRVLGARIELGSTAQGAGSAPVPAVACTPAAGGAARLAIGRVPSGGHRLQIELAAAGDAVATDGDVTAAPPVRFAAALRVLPAVVELRLPDQRPRFLAGVLQTGMLARTAAGLVDGPGWLLDPTLRAYVQGQLWVGGANAQPLAIVPASPGASLLPEVAPVVGRNVFAVALRDVLDRPVVVRGAPAAHETGGGAASRVVIADFWFHDGGPEAIGEELLVEHGQPLRLRLRCPLPFVAAEAPELRLGMAQSEVAAAKVDTGDDGRSEVAFDVPFAVWSVAAQLAETTRDDFAARLQRRVDAYVVTPAGRYPLQLRLCTARSTLLPLRLGELGVDDPVLAAMRFLPVLAPSTPFAEPLPAKAPPRALYRSQVAVSVRNCRDLLLQEHELTGAEARALAAFAATLPAARARLCVHAEDPLGQARLQTANLLPKDCADGDTSLTGVDWFQAYTLLAVLGERIGGDPLLFRLPFGCELELAAYARSEHPAANGAAAAGGRVAIAPFRAAANGSPEPPSAAASLAAGDFVPGASDVPFVGLDFGVREWVFDLPAVPGAEMLVREWIGDHDEHLESVRALAAGRLEPMPDPVGPVRRLAVVRGLAFAEVGGLLSANGEAMQPRALAAVPDVVPGVLRSEQLRRDGSDLLGRGREPRLVFVGLRAAADARGLLRERRPR